MRRFWISLAVLWGLLGATLCNTCYLRAYTHQLTALLTQAQTCAAGGDWDAAADRTEAALETWKSRETYLHMVLPHKDTDEILLDFHQVLQLLYHREDGGEYAATNTRLITRIGLLYEMEQFNLKNLL
jgi:hypothetical protein